MKIHPKHGWLTLQKPYGITSFNALYQLRKIFPKTKLGHAGTLDPLACGVLPVALGEATKVISYAMKKIKTYQFEIVWGEQRSTDDFEGEIIERSAHRPGLSQVMNILPKFHGQILQKPPVYSAIKISGKRACDRARLDEKVELIERTIQIHHLKMLDFHPEYACFEVECGAGTYVRALARDIAIDLGTFGYARHIERTQVGFFKKDASISLEALALSAQTAVLEDYIQPLDAVLADIPAVQVDSSMVTALRCGQSVVLNQGVVIRSILSFDEPIVVYDQNFQVTALAQIKEGRIYPKRIFNIN